MKIQRGNFTIKSANIFTVYISFPCLISKYPTIFWNMFLGLFEKTVCTYKGSWVVWENCVYLKGFLSCLEKQYVPTRVLGLFGKTLYTYKGSCVVWENCIYLQVFLGCLGKLYIPTRVLALFGKTVYTYKGSWVVWENCMYQQDDAYTVKVKRADLYRKSCVLRCAVRS
jgi:hypothetical protein